MPRSQRALLKLYDDCSEQVRGYFEHFRPLIENYPYEVALSYAFGQVELAQTMTLYCGVVKIHRVDARLARAAVDAYHMSRAGFLGKVEAIYGKPLPKAAQRKLTSAEGVRDKVMHGKGASDQEKRTALANVLRYAEAVNAFLDPVAGLQPFGSLRGFKGRARSLDRSTSRWVLKGMGFPV